MIRSLEDAWRWYEAVSDLVGMMDRVARRYLSEEKGKQTLEETLHRDDKFRTIESATIRDLAKRVTEDI
ncbi:MAG: hypothetical protein ABSE84_14730, partial [Isosphaeraceae bacterium]